MRAVILDASVFEEVEADTNATWQAALVVVLSSLAAGLGAAGIQGPSPALQLTISVVALMTWAAWAMLVLQIGARWIPERRTHADMGQLLRTVGFAAAPGLIQVFAMQPPLTLPVFVGAWLWMFAAMVIAIRQALDYKGTGRALLVTFMGFSLIAGLIVVLSLLSPAAGAAAHDRAEQTGPERVYLSVSSQQGQPMAGLTADDFFIEIDGRRQEIVSVLEATEPVSVLILTDRLGVTSDYRPGDLRQAITGFVATVRDNQQDSQFALTTFDSIVVQTSPFGTSPAAIDRALDRMTVPENDAPLVDALTDACRMVRSAPTRRRAILLVFGAFRPDQGNPRPDIAGQTCRLSGASVWAIEARASDGRNYPSPARELVVDQVARSSGGLHELATTSQQLANLARIMAGLIGGQYVVTYGPDAGTATSQRTVGVRGTDVVVLAPTWVAR